MIALLLFSYACCGIGVWFGWYLRGRRVQRTADFTVPRGTTLYVNGTAQPTIGQWTIDWSQEAVDELLGRTVTAQDSTE